MPCPCGLGWLVFFDETRGRRMSVKLAREFVGTLVIAIAILSAGACSKPGPQTAESKAVATGGKLYAANCASCHNPTNPNLPGSVGPPIAGASQIGRASCRERV